MGPWGFIIPFSFLPHVFEIFYNKKLKTKNELLLLERRLGQLFLSAWEHGGGPGGLEPVCQRRRPSQLSLSPFECLLSPSQCNEGAGGHRADTVLSYPLALFFWFGWA